MPTQAAAQDAAAATADAGRSFGDTVGATVEAQLSRVLLPAAAKAIADAKPDSGKGALREAQADAEAVRVALLGPLAEAERWLAGEVYARSLDALALGWKAGVEEQNAALPAGVSLGLADDADAIRKALADWPILGHTAGEVATYQAAAWRFAAEGVLGQAGASGDAVAVVPGLADAGRAAGNRASSAVAEAFQSGAGAARLAVGEALRRAV